MALFGSASQRPDEEEYSPVNSTEDETKPLRVGIDPDAAEVADVSHREMFALSRSLRRTNLYLKIIIGLLCITIIALASINVPDTVHKMIKSATCETPDSLIKTPVPPIPIQTSIFKEHAIFSQRPNQISNQNWDDLLPEGRGFVYVKEWEKYNLPPGQNTTWGMIYSVAVFHQMHCLAQMRRFSWLFLDAIVQNDTMKMAKIKKMFIEMDHVGHMNHCFDYLRQTIQCGGDMALEWPRTEPNGGRFAVDGWNIPHECKDWSHIMRYMDEYHFDHSMVSDIAPLFGIDKRSLDI